MKRSLAPEVIECLQSGKHTAAEVAKMMNHHPAHTVRNSLLNLAMRGRINKSVDSVTGLIVFSAKNVEEISLVEEFNNLLAPLKGWRVI